MGQIVIPNKIKQRSSGQKGKLAPPLHCYHYQGWFRVANVGFWSGLVNKMSGFPWTLGFFGNPHTSHLLGWPTPAKNRRSSRSFLLHRKMLSGLHMTTSLCTYYILELLLHTHAVNGPFIISPFSEKDQVALRLQYTNSQQTLNITLGCLYFRYGSCINRWLLIYTFGFWE